MFNRDFCSSNINWNNWNCHTSPIFYFSLLTFHFSLFTSIRSSSAQSSSLLTPMA